MDEINTKNNGAPQPISTVQEEPQLRPRSRFVGFLTSISTIFKLTLSIFVVRGLYSLFPVIKGNRTLSEEYGMSVVIFHFIIMVIIFMFLFTYRLSKRRKIPSKNEILFNRFLIIVFFGSIVLVLISMYLFFPGTAGLHYE